MKKLNYQNVKIRAARPEDAKALLEAERHITLEPGQLLSLPHELQVDAFEQKIAHLQDNPHGVYLVAEVDGLVAAHGLLDPSQLKSTSHVAQLSMAVHVGHQGNKLGEKLLVNLKQWACTESKLEKIELHVCSVNTRALSLYKKYSFQEEGRFKRRVKLNDDTYVDQILMGRWL
jgi:ribosomal protein S18 acetylase RimI-like enzyme